MPYALIPDGFTLQKVNKGELEAVNRHNRDLAIRRFTGSRNSSVILLVGAAVGLYFLSKQIKIPNFSLKDSFAAAFPQLSAVLGIKGKLSAKGVEQSGYLIQNGAIAYYEKYKPDEEPPQLMIILFPSREEMAAREEETPSWLGI